MRSLAFALALVGLVGCYNAYIATDGREFSSTAAESTKEKPLRQAVVASGVKDLQCPERSVEVVSTEPPTVEGCNKRATYTLAKSGKLTLDKVVDNTPSAPDNAKGNGLQWQ